MNFYFLQPAKEELEEAVAYYEKQKAGLGVEFAQEIADTIQRILDHPEAWEKLSKNTRRCKTKRFPYGIIYSVQNEGVCFIAVMHLHRKPGYWKGRV